MALSLLWGAGALIKLDFEAAGGPAAASSFAVLLELVSWPEVGALLLETKSGRGALVRVYEALVSVTGCKLQIGLLSILSFL